MSKKILRELEFAIIQRDASKATKAMDVALTTSLDPKEIRSSLFSGLNDVRRRLMREISIPEFLISIDIVNECLARIKVKEKEAFQRIVVIGVVESDPHDLGKNIVASVYKSAGYDVIDLGKNVPHKEFVEAVVSNNADILALSAMMSTTMIAMPRIISETKLASPNTRVMVGGACLNRTIARLFGADGYAESAVTVLEETEEVMCRP